MLLLLLSRQAGEFGKAAAEPGQAATEAGELRHPAAETRQALGQSALGGSLLKRVLAIYERQGNDANIAATLGNLARLYNEQGRYREAEELLTRAGGIYARVSGTNDWPYANTSLNLAITYKNQGRYGAAEKAAQRALSIFERTKRDQSDVSLTLNLLAAIYAYQGRQSEAVELYKRTVAMHPTRSVR